MFRTPYASIRVPDVDDVNMDQALVDMATDIQYRTDRNSARLAEVMRRRGVMVEAPGTTPMASGAVVTAIWSDVLWDTDDYVDLVVSTTAIVLPRGLFLITGSALISGANAFNTALIQIIGSVDGYIVGHGNGPYASAATATLTTMGMVYSTATQNVTMVCYQTSGVAATLTGAKLGVAKIGAL